MCPLTKLQSLHNAKDDTFNWLETTAITALAENEMNAFPDAKSTMPKH